MTFCILCGINSKHSDILKKRRGRGYILKIITKLYVTRYDDTTSFCYKSYNNIGCDDDEEEEVDSDDMEYTEDAIDNMILEFSGD
jgi:hypothetical protein